MSVLKSDPAPSGRTAPGPEADRPEPAAHLTGGRRDRGRAGSAGGQHHGGRLTYTVLIVVTVIALFPLFWTAVAASRNNTRLAETPPPFWFGGNLFKNLETAWTDANMGLALLNTTIVAGSIAAGTVLFGTIAGFAFAKLRFRFR